jgi:hypothetical protein
MNNTQFITLIIIGWSIVFVGGLQVLQETPNERVERINRNANRECQTSNLEYDRGCYEWHYSQIEDRV